MSPWTQQRPAEPGWYFVRNLPGRENSFPDPYEVIYFDGKDCWLAGRDDTFGPCQFDWFAAVAPPPGPPFPRRQIPEDDGPSGRTIPEGPINF